MKITNTDAIDEAQINMLINVRIKAINQKDIDSVMYNYASDYEMSDLKITAANNLAFCFSLNHIVANKTNGGKLDMWWRETVCYRRLNGMWLITHVHSSVPLICIAVKRLFT